MCCTQIGGSRRRRGIRKELEEHWLLLSTGVVLLAVAVQNVGAENPKQVGGTGGTFLPPTLLPMKRNKPPTLPCEANKLLNAGDEFYIESPEFKTQKYPNSAYCEWKFAANRCSMGINCADFQLTEFLCFDHLDIVDNFGNGTVKKYCGRKGPKETVLSDNVTISFTSSAWFPDQGFRCKVVCRETTSDYDESPFEKSQANSTSCHCGKADQRVVGGTDAEISTFPWMAGLVRKGGSTPFCGGSLINSRYVLTAGHCVQGRTPYNLEIIFNVTTFDNTGGQVMEVRRVVENVLVHRKFSSRLDYDAALVRLSEPVDISGASGASLLPICLPTEKDLEKMYVGENATVTGWGLTKEDGEVSPTLQKAEVEVISNEDCMKYNPTITDRMLCAHTPGRDACQGDSGGPLFVEEGESDENDKVQILENLDMPSHFVQVGIVSWGQGCGVKPGVYSRVTELIKWIAANTQDGSYCDNHKET